jgi:adenosylcobyric acid synthase
MTRGLLIAGTTSDAGKSLVTAGVCRMLARAGISVAPFKSQNMSNNSMVCAASDGRAAEIGRAQWLQAVAARVVPEPAMNPVLLKPGSDRRSHIVLMGQPAGTLEAGEFATGRAHLAATAYDAFRSLASRYDVVVAEGAGSPAEVNLRAGDYVNMGLAREMGLPVVVVGDIDRGGVLAAMYGTLALLDDADQALIRGWLVNKFRGDVTLLEPGLEVLGERTGRPVLGVLPWLDDVWIDSEDALAIGAPSHVKSSASVEISLRVAVIRFPRISNATDIDALASERAVDISFTARPVDVSGADLVVLPGSRATVSDLAWLRTQGLDRALAARVAAGRPVLGICGGYQMLARTIADPEGVESGGTTDGLALLPTTVTFGTGKQLGLPRGSWRGQDVAAYAIHHGVATLDPGAAVEPFLDGWSAGSVFGTTWHGAFENDGFRRAFLTHIASLTGSPWTAEPGAASYGSRREAMLDRLADALEEHVGLDAFLEVIDAAAETATSKDNNSHLAGRELPLRVVGIGADGWAGLAAASRAAIVAAGVIVGGQRQLDLLPAEVTAERVAWPSPLRPSVRALVEQYALRGLVVLASGDPMWHGIGRTLQDEVGADYDIEVLPHPSSVTLACARMGWPVEQTQVVSLLTEPIDVLRGRLQDGARLLVLSRDETTPGAVAAALTEWGFGASTLTVLGDLGGPTESRVSAPASEYDGSSTRLNVVAIEVTGQGLPVVPGLPDESFEHDGQLTKREIRAVTLSALAPRPGELLWDIGGGAGSIAIEWLRAAPTCRAIAIEQDPARAQRITANAAALGVPALEVVTGSAPAALEGLEPPDVVFVGGGLTTDGVLEAAWAALRPGGRLVANAVTLESQADLVRRREKLGGTLTRLEVARSTAVGRFTGWRPAMPVVQWHVVSTGSTTERKS